MLLTEMWKQKMKSILVSIYGEDMLHSDKLDDYLQAYVDEALKKKNLKLKLRNIYKRETFSVDLNSVLDFIKERNLIIGANGSFLLNANEKESEVAQVIVKGIESRDKSKDLEKEFERIGDFKQAKKHGNIQNAKKQNNNSMYGVQTQSGSILYNPDSASMITLQSRELISQTCCGFEKLLALNPMCHTFNEVMMLFDSVKHCEKNWILREYITYIPTKNEVRKIFLRYLVDIDDYTTITSKLYRTLFLYIERLTDEEVFYCYYKNNLHALIFKNPKILNLFKEILDTKDEFLNPYKIPEAFKENYKLLHDIIIEYAVHHISTFNRVEKYKNKTRDTTVVSDTDSNIECLEEIIDDIYDKLGYEISESNDFKLVNTFSAILSSFLVGLHQKFAKDCNIDIEPQDVKLYMKNEFYFRKMFVYKKVKKNYATYSILREGNILPEAKRIATTGIKLNSSTIHPYIRALQRDIIENDILKTDKTDKNLILMKIYKAKGDIIEAIKNGDKTFGVTTRFAGAGNYKVESAANCRTAEAWNRIYPLDTILAGDAMYTFTTTLNTKADALMINNPEIRNIVLTNIFGEYYDGQPNALRSYGLRLFSVPRDGNLLKLPDWIVPFIDYETMAIKHLRPVIDILPSLGGKITMNKQKQVKYSSLVQF